MAMTTPLTQPDPAKALERIKELLSTYVPWDASLGRGEADTAFETVLAETEDEAAALDAYNSFRATSALDAEALIEKIWRAAYDETEKDDGAQAG